MSLSRGQPVPAAFSAICTRPEQSIAEAALAAPQIWRADKTLGHRDEIRRHRVEAAKMLAAAGTSPGASPRTRRRRAATVSIAPISSVSTGGNLIDGPGNANVRIAVTLCVGVAPGFANARSGSQPT